MHWTDSYLSPSACVVFNIIFIALGFAGGSHYTHAGGAAEYLCLPKDPIYPTDFTSLDVLGYMYGAEYQQASGSLKDHDVPCAVCRSTLSSIVMIPARDKCYNGWTQQYNGTLASGDYRQAASSQFVCLDANRKWEEAVKEIKTGNCFTLSKLHVLTFHVHYTSHSRPCPVLCVLNNVIRITKNL